jgi:hypothetical protein
MGDSDFTAGVGAGDTAISVVADEFTAVAGAAYHGRFPLFEVPNVLTNSG